MIFSFFLKSFPHSLLVIALKACGKNSRWSEPWGNINKKRTIFFLFLGRVFPIFGLKEMSSLLSSSIYSVKKLRSTALTQNSVLNVMKGKWYKDLHFYLELVKNCLSYHPAVHTGGVRRGRSVDVAVGMRDMQNLTHDTWNVTSDILHTPPYIWHLTHDTWQTFRDSVRNFFNQNINS